MKINSIKNINFGYNPEYHTMVQDKLKNRKNNTLSKHYAALDLSANNIEDEIIKLEERGYIKTDKYKAMCDSVIKWRSDIAFYVAQNFQDLYYPDTLIYQYCDEMGSDIESPKNDWRKNMCQSLKKYSVRFNNQPLPYEPHEIPIQANPIKPAPVIPLTNPFGAHNVSSASAGSSSSTPTSELAVKFIPTQSSPKGFDDVYAMDEIKQKLQQDIIEYIKNPDLKQMDFEEYGITPPSTFLFYGPPGCGKTYLAQALAMETGLDMYKIDISKIGSSYVNKTANNLQNIFDALASQAKKSKKPIILFMDEVDSLAIKRDKDHDSSENLKTTTTLLKIIQEAKDNNIIIIAATNKYRNLDDAFISRFESETYFGLFDEKQIKILLKSSLLKKSKGVKLANDDEALDKLSKKLLGYSNRTIGFIIAQAANEAKNNNRSDITLEIFESVIKKSNYEKVDEANYKKGENVTRKVIQGFLAHT